MLPSFNLKPLGMGWVIDPRSKNAIPDNASSLLRKFKNDDETVISGSGVTYKKLAVLGRGSYGAVVSCERSTDKRKVAVKILSDTSIQDTIKETIIQTIIYYATKDIKHPEIGLNGPYCPAVYEVGHDSDTGETFIVSELMAGTTYKLLTASDGFNDVLETLVPTVLVQISTMLVDLYRLLKFNHRDFKSDNCMYIRDDMGNVQARLIDFGFSCINYGNIQISGGGGSFEYCSLESRDLTQYIYELYKYHGYLPRDLREVFEAVLTFKEPGGTCEMYRKCEDMTEWRDTYKFLNTQVVNPNGRPQTVLNIFKAYLDGRDWRKELGYSAIKLPAEKPAVPIKCPRNKVYNPNTQRCVSAVGSIGKRLLRSARNFKDKKTSAAAVAIKACPPKKPDYNPKTRRCVLPCKSGKKRNSTFKCVRG